MIATSPRTSRNSPANPTARRIVGPSASIIDGAVSTVLGGAAVASLFGAGGVADGVGSGGVVGLVRCSRSTPLSTPGGAVVCGFTPPGPAGAGAPPPAPAPAGAVLRGW